MRSKSVWIVVALVVAVAFAPAMARRDFTAIEDGLFTIPVDVTADGSTFLVAGFFGSPVWTWTKEDGLTVIGNGGCSGGQARMSSDGSTIVGNEPDENGICQAALLEDDGTWTVMGSEPGALPCGGSGISSSFDTNNDTAVGLFWKAQLCKAEGGTWDLASRTAGPALFSTVPNRASRGNAITDDGSIVFGWQDNDFGSRQAARWEDGVQTVIVDGEGNNYGEVIGSNSSGSVFWGTSYQFAGDGRGWLFRDGEGFMPMGQGVAGGGNTQSVPLGASEDGSVVIGITRDFIQFIEYGWIWTEKKGWQVFDDFLKGQTAAGWQIMIPSVISPDGTKIGGRGFNPDGQIQGWILDLKASGNPNN